ncbi:hypothetical protein LCGC14_1740610 [marine sediment metagenome]|uniref:Methyltransferase domain-containing protein n=1 Tax=marine sediment metagenome TaxID=412755 RepID=A0A0F9H6T8_9ZZZZ
MTNIGVSESLVNLELDCNTEDSMVPIDTKTYEAFRQFSHKTNAEIGKQSDYAMINKAAHIGWCMGVNSSDRFISAYSKRSSDMGRLAIEISERLKDIKKYAESIQAGEQFPPIVLVYKEKLLFQIDGARRIMAHLLADRRIIDTIVVVHRRKIHEFIESEFKAKIQKLHSTPKWFNDYQEIIELKMSGKRAYKNRFPMLDFSILRGKTVAEFGCSNGMAILEAAYCGAKRVVGFEYVVENVKMINLIGKRLGLPIEAHHIDFNHEDFSEQLDGILPEYDYAVYLSVHRTKELKNRDGIVQIIWKRCKEGMIFEGHNHRHVDTDEYYQALFAKLDNCSVQSLPRGVIDKPYDNWYRPKYLLKRDK